MTIKLSQRDARRLFLASQGLLQSNSFGRGLGAVQKTIEKLAYIQIDTISVIERAHNHILWSRVDNYNPAMLDRLQQPNRSVFEYWFHAAAYLPMRDYRFYLPAMQSFAARKASDSKLTNLILHRIEQEGPLKARDFEDRSHKSSGWWNWKPSKRAMEHLFLSGELMVTGREGFQKLYDLRDRVLPDDVNTLMPTRQEWQYFHIKLMINALGLTTDREIAYLRVSTRKLFKQDILQGIKTALAELVEEGELETVNVAGITYYTTKANLCRIPQRVSLNQVRFLSPFDNLVIQRKRISQLFDFDYQLECYVPAAKRKYGYFVLPLLWGDQLVGRMDTKADRKSRTFHIFNLMMEDSFSAFDRITQPLLSEIKRFARFQGCETIKVHASLDARLTAIAALDGYTEPV